MSDVSTADAAFENHQDREQLRRDREAAWDRCMSQCKAAIPQDPVQRVRVQRSSTGMIEVSTRTDEKRTEKLSRF